MRRFIGRILRRRPLVVGVTEMLRRETMSRDLAREIVRRSRERAERGNGDAA